MSPGENKDASTINDSSYHNSDEQEDEISYSDKKVELSKEPITDTHVHNTSVGTTSVYPAVIGVGIIGRGGRGFIQGGWLDTDNSNLCVMNVSICDWTFTRLNIFI